MKRPAASAYRRAVKAGACLDVAVLVICALLLDGGYTARCCLVSLVAKWLVTLVMVRRRVDLPSSRDLLFIRYGILVLLPVTCVLAPLVWFVIGESAERGLDRLRRALGH
jgi:hypothetical protein